MYGLHSAKTVEGEWMHVGGTDSVSVIVSAIGKVCVDQPIASVVCM